MTRDTKQVIVFRKDLLKGPNSIRKGKFAAQVAHASVGSLLTLFAKTRGHLYDRDETGNIHEDGQTYYRLETTFTSDTVLDYWLNGSFKKVVVSVEGEEELLRLRDEVRKKELPHSLITDCGATEFHGVPTVTCLGIGPFYSDELDKITGELPLL